MRRIWKAAPFSRFSSSRISNELPTCVICCGCSVCVASSHDDGDNYNIDWWIYKLSGASFAEFQSLPTSGANGWHSFEIAGEHYLAMANYHNEYSFRIDSKIYKWQVPSTPSPTPNPTGTPRHFLS